MTMRHSMNLVAETRGESGFVFDDTLLRACFCLFQRAMPSDASEDPENEIGQHEPEPQLIVEHRANRRLHRGF